MLSAVSRVAEATTTELLAGHGATPKDDKTDTTLDLSQKAEKVCRE